MSDNKGTSSFSFFLAGLGVGAIGALLFAPKSGEETRQYLAEKAGAGKDYVTTKGKELSEKTEDILEKGRVAVTKEKTRFAEAIEEGKRAYRAKVAG